MYSGRDLPKGGVSPFGHPRINDRSHLPAAFRSVPRPSSPLGAKASTERPSHTHPSPPARRTKPHPKARHRRACPIGQRRNTETLTPTGSQPVGSLDITKSDSPVKQQDHPDGQRPSEWGFPEASQPRGRNSFTMEAIGFEPTTPCLQSRRSPAELRPLTGTLPSRHEPGPKVTDPRTTARMGQGGLEPPTPRLSSVCSNQLSYWPKTQQPASPSHGTSRCRAGKDARPALLPDRSRSGHRRSPHPGSDQQKTSEISPGIHQGKVQGRQCCRSSTAGNRSSHPMALP